MFLSFTLIKKVSQNSSFNHPLYPGIPLDMPLLNPQPGLSIGNIGLGAKIVVGIPTVKVCLYIHFFFFDITKLNRIV